MCWTSFAPCIEVTNHSIEHYPRETTYLRKTMQCFLLTLYASGDPDEDGLEPLAAALTEGEFTITELIDHSMTRSLGHYNRMVIAVAGGSPGSIRSVHLVTDGSLTLVVLSTTTGHYSVEYSSKWSTILTKELFEQLPKRRTLAGYGGTVETVPLQRDHR